MANQSTCTKSSRKWQRLRLHQRWNQRRISDPTADLQRNLRGRIRIKIQGNRLRTQSRLKFHWSLLMENQPSLEKAATYVLIADSPAQNQAFCKNTSEPTQTKDLILVYPVVSHLRPNRISTSTADLVLMP